METNETSGVEPEDLLEQFVRLEWLMRREHLRRHHAHGPMATPQRGQGRILSLLKLKPEISQKELSNILDMRPQSLGELLAKLEKAGYIVRTPSETDRRGMNVKLTEAGRAAAEQPDEDSGRDSVFGVLTEEERTNLSAYFAKIAAQLEAEGPEDFSGLHERLRGFGPHGRHGFGHRGFGPHGDEAGGGPGFGPHRFHRW